VRVETVARYEKAASLPLDEMKKATALTITERKELSPPLSLTPQERRFAEEFFSGEHAGNATRSYLAIHPDSSYDTASVEASTLLKQPNVRSFLEYLHQEATGLTVGKLIPWVDVLPVAQAVIIAAANGKVRGRLAYEAAVYICNRVMGTRVSVGSHEIIVRDEARIAQAVSAFTKRMADENRRRAREVVAG
jgi:hypothetical protein